MYDPRTNTASETFFLDPPSLHRHAYSLSKSTKSYVITESPAIESPSSHISVNDLSKSA